MNHILPADARGGDVLNVAKRALCESKKMCRLSVVINNYNYARFLGAAIDSALAVDWPDKEIIVVDDGSTDASRAVAARYGSGIIPIFKENGGQKSALNVGFARSTGNVIIFLDADDRLLPGVGRAIVSVWHDGVAKVQYPLLMESEGETDSGKSWPRYTEEHTPLWAKQCLLKHAHYLHSPTSGNAWSRDFLSQVLPLPTRNEDASWSVDYYLSMLAPLLGETISLCVPQAVYRIHGANRSKDITYITKYASCSVAVNGFLKSRAMAPLRFDRSEFRAKVVLIHARFPWNKAAWPKLLFAYWRTVWYADDAPIGARLRWLVWSLLLSQPSSRLAQWALAARDHWSHPKRKHAGVAGDVR